MPIPLLANKSPDQMLFSTFTSYSHLESLDACVMQQPLWSITTTNLIQDQGGVSSLVYPFGVKGYKLYDLDT